jgi:hypothetical protein
VSGGRSPYNDCRATDDDDDDNDDDDLSINILIKRFMILGTKLINVYVSKKIIFDVDSITKVTIYVTVTVIFYA